MSLSQEVELIRHVPILSNLAPAAQKMLCFASERMCYEAGQVLFRQGDAADAAYILIDGAVEIVVWTASGSLLVNTVEQYGVIGETGMFGDLPRSATAVAKTRLEALRVPKDVFCQTIHGNPEAALRLTCMLAERLASTTARLSLAVA
jgi:CRP-like cAMP-binding protein